MNHTELADALDECNGPRPEFTKRGEVPWLLRQEAARRLRLLGELLHEGGQ
ncbi:MAG TPA: hypothetical protein VIX41_03550 [Acidimicrobiales bacterium]